MKMAKRLLALLLALTMLLALALPAGATEKQTSPIKKAAERVLSSKLDYYGTGYVYPFASFYNASVVKGSSVTLRFRKNPDMNCPKESVFCFTIIRGSMDQLEYFDESDIIEERYIPVSSFSKDKNGYAVALTWAADSRYSVGTYTAMCFTMNADETIDADQLIYFTELYVVDQVIPATELEILTITGGNFDYFNYYDTCDWGAELCLVPMLFPFASTTPRKNLIVSSSNNSYVSATVEDDYIILRGKTYGAPATITVICDGATQSFPIMFGAVPKITATQGKNILCPDQTDQIVYSPKDIIHTFTSSNPSVLKVNNDGLVTAVAPGTAEVTLSMGYQTLSLRYTVQPHMLAEDAPIIGTAATATKSVYQIGKCAICGMENAINVLQPSIFSDTSPNAWYSDHVDYAYEHNIFTGVTANEFKPNQSLTRGQMATVLYRIAGSPEVSSACPFTDVPSGRYYYRAILWAAENGIVTGYTDQTFHPDSLITREQIAAILYRYVHYTGTEIAGDPTLLEAFPDADKVGNYAKSALAWAVAEGLITGVATEGTTYLNPKNSATRAQVATILSRYLNAEPTEE